MDNSEYWNTVRQMNADNARAQAEERNRQELRRSLRILGRRAMWLTAIVGGVIVYKKYKSDGTPIDEDD